MPHQHDVSVLFIFLHLHAIPTRASVRRAYMSCGVAAVAGITSGASSCLSVHAIRSIEARSPPGSHDVDCLSCQHVDKAQNT